MVPLAWVIEAADLLLTHMALLFVPAGVGVMLYFELIGGSGCRFCRHRGSTFVVMAVTGHLAQRLEVPTQTGADGDG